MNRRITITLDNNIESKLREIQAEKITTNKKSVSFSFVINQVLQNALQISKN